jgi:translation initiation factor 2 beta subunit (eIF-2beta)/eIF-5
MSADNKNRRIWQLINEGTCTSQNKNNNIAIINGKIITSELQQIADKFNAFFIDTI